MLEQGLDLIVWTYDPLESVNACLNFGKLGGLSDDYQVNLYGETTSKLHAGSATDRLTLKWMVDSPRVARARRGGAGRHRDGASRRRDRRALGAAGRRLGPRRAGSRPRSPARSLRDSGERSAGEGRAARSRRRLARGHPRRFYRPISSAAISPENAFISPQVGAPNPVYLLRRGTSKTVVFVRAAR